MRIIRFAAVWLILSAVAGNACAQKMILLEVEPIIGWGNASMGSGGYDIELRGHYEKFGIKLAYANSYTKETDEKKYYEYFNMQKGIFSWRFAHKKESFNDDHEDEVAHLLNVGYNRIAAYKHQVFDAVDPTLKVPTNDSLESRRYLDVYGTNVKFNTNFISVGYERLKKGYSKSGRHKVLRSFNGIDWFESESSGGTVFYTSSLYFDFLLLPPGGVTYSPRLTTNLYALKSGSPTPVMETIYKNHVGFRMGYEISMIGIFAFNIGVETGVIPGIFQYATDYGSGFPMDNLYFCGKAGFTIGKANRPKKGIKK
jgi:hypothetical protein